ncbi:LysR family transcriptional regulator [Sporosarcina highlanderae]|uniref:LysR family transcriptional regulator n=1 Tax=Sporosarcina highlanderae TaxID=3035916 RepID=A0ABT8JT84_9BACL|nr:LysR family transcriptional regulator [Sporosarcina highlanderae]MDN4608107.1 LysR family transcriptional regulator [Sporosarcina highlanderae]
MDIRHLKYFESIARNKNFTKAAEELFISQPSLSNMIKKMEENFGSKLIERTTREVILTEMGEALYVHAKKILGLYTITLKEMEEIKKIGKGEIHIGII